MGVVKELSDRFKAKPEEILDCSVKTTFIILDNRSDTS